MLRIPAVVREQAAALGADDWLHTVPQLVADVSAEWSLGVTETLDGGTEALVAAVTLEDGSPAVLKLPIPGRDHDHEVTALKLAGGEGRPDRIVARRVDRRAHGRRQAQRSLR